MLYWEEHIIRTLVLIFHHNLCAQAVWTAAKAVFGDHIRVQGCFFHLTQSTWRKVQTLGLTTRYKDDDDVKQFCGMMDALAFLPINDLHEGNYLNHCTNI